MKLEVKIREIKEPAGLSAVQVLWLLEVREVLVVGEDLYWVRRAM